MPTPTRIRELTGKRVALRLAPSAMASSVRGRVTGTLEAADGLVVVIDREDEAGKFSCNYQHILEVEELPG